MHSAAELVVERCRAIARCTTEPGKITRTFLSPPMKDVQTMLRTWLESAGCTVKIDAAGNLRALRPAQRTDTPHLLIGSHLDSVPDAGAFDGVLGVVIAVALIEKLGSDPLPFAIEVIGFSEEEGVRFGVPFIGSRAVAGTLDEELIGRISPAISEFGLDPDQLRNARLDAPVIGYLEFHIEQGPVLDRLGLPLAVVEAIAGQTRCIVEFQGKANHAGTTPMDMRADALTGAAEWICAVEREACRIPGAVATVGKITVDPGAGNVIAGSADATLDVRHACDDQRHRLVQRLKEIAADIAKARGLQLLWEQRLDQCAAPMDAQLSAVVADAVQRTGQPVHRMISGAGHDAMIMAQRWPSAMLFLRSPGGVSHHPDETVHTADVAAALEAGAEFLRHMTDLYA